MEEYGSKCNIWEGGCNGEKYSELKYRLRGGLKDNWHIKLLQNILIDDAMKQVVLSILQEAMKMKSRDSQFKKYGTINNLMIDYQRRKLISIVIFRSGRWGTIIDDDKEEVEITFCRGRYYTLLHAATN
jgi:hypothetical protein